jgi:hypothetical protein
VLRSQDKMYPFTVVRPKLFPIKVIRLAVVVFPDRVLLGVTLGLLDDLGFRATTVVHQRLATKWTGYRWATAGYM